MAVNAIYVLNLQGKVIISRNYRGDLSNDVAKKFSSMLLDEEAIRPIMHDGELTYMHVSHENLYLLAVTQNNSNVAMIFHFMYKLIDVFTEYFKEVEEESIRDNFTVVHELLDEVMDFGYPQITEPKVLQGYILQEASQLNKPVMVKWGGSMRMNTRPEGISYRKNEIFLDVVEEVHLLMAANGAVLRSEVQGAIKVRCCLSGMPDIQLALDDKARFQSSHQVIRNPHAPVEDLCFHQAVRLDRFNTDRVISLTPPDGAFELMGYRVHQNIKPLILVESIVESHKGSRVEYVVKARSNFKERTTAENVIISIPVPSDVDTPQFKTSIGTVMYAPEQNLVLWTIKHFQGGKEYQMKAHFGLQTISAEEIKFRPVSVQFRIPNFSISGIRVRYLKVEERSGYSALTWVRYATQSGSYQIKSK